MLYNLTKGYKPKGGGEHEAFSRDHYIIRHGRMLNRADRRTTLLSRDERRLRARSACETGFPPRQGPVHRAVRTPDRRPDSRARQGESQPTADLHDGYGRTLRLRDARGKGTSVYMWNASGAPSSTDSGVVVR